ncbi:hypothetical protein GW17_00055370 [Ensete ventricosum]|nr:hypothetical protein GW17_00055370 [Ensete ventricosum]
MHPVRFPNSGIRAKIFVRKIGFKLRVMRLNRVELFYALVVAIGSESRCCLRGRGGHMHAVCMQRWMAMAKPPAGAVGHSLATCKGRSAVARPLARGDRPQEQQPARGGHLRARSAAASPQGPTGKGLPPAAIPAASRGDGAGRRGGRPLVRWLLAANGSRRLRRGSSGNSTVRVEN